MEAYKIAGIILCSTLVMCCTVGTAMYYAVNGTKGDNS